MNNIDVSEIINLKCILFLRYFVVKVNISVVFLRSPEWLVAAIQLLHVSDIEDWQCRL